MSNNFDVNERRTLAALIAEALHLADALNLSLVGIALSTALDRLTDPVPQPLSPSLH